MSTEALQLSLPGLTGQSSNPGDAAVYWIPAFAGMRQENGRPPYRFRFTEAPCKHFPEGSAA
jgi:hypothetical protein